MKILFVDDEPSMLRVLKIGMRSMADVWKMDFVGSGEEALALIEINSYDVVVTDMRMPGLNGAQLLNHVLRRHPHIIRIVLSGYSELSEAVSCVGLTHQFLTKPCSLDMLKDCLRRVATAKARLANSELSRLTGRLQNLPSLPEIYLSIADALQSPTTSAQRIADIASKDPGIAAKLLQLANSAYFGFGRKVFSLTEAVQLLGVSVIQSLAMAVPIFSQFPRSKCPNFPIDQVWDHSVQTGVLSRRLFNEQVGDAHLAEQAFCAGLLHDIGKIILADNLTAPYAAVLEEARATHTPLVEVERRHLQATHAEVGGYLLALWGLPMPLVEAVAGHHYPNQTEPKEFSLAGFIHVANFLQNSQATQPDFAVCPVDADYLKHVGMDQQFETWRTEFAGRTS
jgi:HD-like signal output (HDOD) protein